MKKKLFSILILLLTTNTFSQGTPSFKILDNPTEGKTFISDSTTNNRGKKVFNYYKTWSNIKKKRFKNKKNKFDSIYNYALSKLDSNAENKLKLTKKQIANFENQLVESRDSIRILNPIIDSLSNEYNKEYLQYTTWSYLKFGPKRARAFFDILYDGKGKRFSVLNNTGFNIGNNTGSIYSELVSGNLSVLRVSLGAMISSSSSDSLSMAKEDEAYQRLVSNGGNTVLNIEYPLAYIHSRNNQFNFISRLKAKGTADFPEFGTTTEEFAGSATIGIDFYADAALTNNQLRFFGAFNYNRIYGTEEFSNNLGIENSNFSFGQLTLGLVFNNIKFSFIVLTLSSEKSLENRNVVAGGQILH
ncbi:hypothetical protein FDT66_13935 [Polaribacter aestuariivivens]|uniref:DUF3078 domain-containing protein n=1 Tax=Polaribacter aestuariivivens TaxID=2304626 RepID=A0A5S3N0Y4_9FLAO|nr:hypothetical protein [Polaribacter aestuariivivens]TMM28432.1 hypothetical protein FDT66_13935 [Polaribacter aestuariivivens]